ncbi:MAG: tetratricopeptide repeat protein [Bacteroidales bacterium]|nr:tetratricopeptide repeat protein [Bacteroidales bacterium]
MLNDRKLLEKKIQIISKEVSNSNIDQTEALLEAWFRLALHSETPFEKAVHYLKSAYRIDKTNPRYSYHLGRLYFISGNFDKASHYLRIAAEHCPTSHRIWAHIGLLQREIEEKYKGNSSFEKNVLNETAAKIDQIIKSGKHGFSNDMLIFEPPPCNTKKDSEEYTYNKINSEINDTKVTEDKLKQVNEIIPFFNRLVKEFNVNIQFKENDNITDTVVKIQTFLEKIIENDKIISELFDNVIIPFSDFVCSNESF